jgi:glycosyltransferase involved in cell wall biosynthesis
MRPVVSVVMPVFNGARDLRRAVASIIQQSYADFELIVINDGSTDETEAVLSGMPESADPRLRVETLAANVGISAALNRGIELAQGEYIARQDHDDISRPMRLERQVRFLRAHPECGLLGTCAEIWSGDEPTDRRHLHPQQNHLLQFELLFDNPFVHSSAMIPKRVFDAVGVYSRRTPLRGPEYRRRAGGLS